MGYKEDRAWADQFNPHISMILGLEFIAEASWHQDVFQGTDQELKPMRLSLRVRKMQKYPSYKNEITLRYRRNSGVETEYSKLLRGDYADYLFYGWGEESQQQIRAYTILDCQRLRQILPMLTMVIKENSDGQSSLAVVHLSEVPPDCILKRKILVEPLQTDLFYDRWTHAVIVK